MKLKSFTLKSYRSCKETTFPINKQITALIGVNGAGKSNILNALMMLRKLPQILNWSFLHHDSRTSIHNTCQFELAITYSKNLIEIRGEITFETDENNNDEIISVYLKWKNVTYTKNGWEDLFNPQEPYKNRFMVPRFYSEKINKIQPLDANEKKKENMINKVMHFFGGINYYSASRFSNPSRCPNAIELEEGELKRRRFIEAHEQFIRDMYQSYKGKGKDFVRFINAVGKRGIGLVDDISFLDPLEMPSRYYKVQSGVKIKTTKRKKLLIVPVFTIDGTKLSPNQLSEGTFRALAIIYYILTDKSTLLLLEEPEVCVHHGLLNSILSLIKSQAKEKQIIISTHSDFVLDHLKPENLLYVKKLSKQGTIAIPLSETMSKNNYKALKNYLKTTGNLGEYWREGGFDDTAL